MIVVCGEALIDVIHSVDGTQRTAPGGGAFNTARALARLGVPTAFLGRLSDDAFGAQLAGLLASDGVRLELAPVGPEPTTTALAELDRLGSAEYEFLVHGTSAPNFTPDMLPAHLGADVAALHLGSLGLVLEPMADTLVELAHREREGRLLMLDPNIRIGLAPESDHRNRVYDVISQSTIVKASEGDLAWLYRGLNYERAADRMLSEGVPMVVVTRGAQGAFGANRSFRIAVDAPQVDVVDTIGAGDAFGAALLAWLHDHGAVRPDLCLEEEELKEALDFACLAAALTCTRPGADPPWKWEMAARPT
ncbi:MAG TPA: carbohydrate kinase [Candidatus Dormibacteraeota bacterium]|nr:carbohydrate kinase [Candidatus Dormibacteraeota bacterium]